MNYLLSRMLKVFLPIFSENRPEENPWIVLYEKLIATEHLSQFLEFIKQASKNATFGTEVSS